MMMKKMVVLMAMGVMLFADGPVLKTGQTAVYLTGDDGTYRKGIARGYSRSIAGVVTDNATGLQWQDDYSDNNGSIKKTNWADAQSYCAALTLDGGGWRLPTMPELRSLLDYSRSNPIIDPVFQKIDGALLSPYYWSSTSYANNTSNAWMLSFYYGYASYFTKSAADDVRCVRGGVE